MRLWSLKKKGFAEAPNTGIEDKEGKQIENLP